MKLTIQKILRKYAWRLLLTVVFAAAFALLQESDRRLLAQIFLTASFFIVALVGYVKLSCPQGKFRRALWKALCCNDFRLLRLFAHSRVVKMRVMGGLGSFFCGVGAVAQIWSGQVDEKPILFFIGAPLVCFVLFWSLLDDKNPKRHDL